jgi:hypothetical protein
MGRDDALESLAKSAFGLVPFVGAALNEAVFDFRSRVKQRRLEGFVADLAKEVGRIGDSAIDRKYIETEEFSDLLEAVLVRATRTRSDERRARLRDVLVSQLCDPRPSDYEERFLDILLSLDETSILILENHRKHGGIETREDYERRVLGAKTPSAQKDGIYPLAPFRTAPHYGIDQDRYEFLVQDLVSHALLADHGMGRMGMSSFELLKVTVLGMEFLRFVKSDASQGEQPKPRPYS